MEHLQYSTVQYSVEISIGYQVNRLYRHPIVISNIYISTALISYIQYVIWDQIKYRSNFRGDLDTVKSYMASPRFEVNKCQY